MHTVAKKVYMSILTCIVILLTMVATTYAWVGILTSGQVSGFDIKLKVEDIDQNYSLKISNDGFNFGDTVPLVDMQKDIINNMGYGQYLHDVSDDQVQRVFDRFCNLTVSSTYVENNNIEHFYQMDGVKVKQKSTPDQYIFNDTGNYFKFDLYLMIEPLEGVQEATEINANVFLDDIGNTIVGNVTTGSLINGNPFGSLPSNEYTNVLKNLPETFSVNSANASRIAFSIYEPIAIDDTYTTQTPINTIIYQGGTQNPSYSNGVYNLGGILPRQYNTALQQLNSIYERNLDFDTIPPFCSSYLSNILDRQNDLELVEANRNIWNQPEVIDNVNYNYLGVSNGVQTKIKMTVYFWFEGWDADCFDFIDGSRIEINLSFCTDTEVI